jgi:hypothetical protein
LDGERYEDRVVSGVRKWSAEKQDPATVYISDSDYKDKIPRVDSNMSDRGSSEDEYYSDNEVEDFSWMRSSAVEDTWKVNDEGVQTSIRARYQQRALQPPL